MIELRAQWALWSKERGDSLDYRVLRHGDGPLTGAELGELIYQHIPASPPESRQPGPAALPWVTFSPAPGADGPGVGVSVLVLEEVSDSFSRRIAPTHYVRVPYGELAGAGVGYAELAAAALTSVREGDGRMPTSIAVEPSTPERVVALVDRLGFERVAMAAALLLEGPVVLLTGRAPDGDDRVRALDAVAALLPFGFRASLAVSSWSDPGGRIRMAFGASAGTNQRPIRWDEGDVPRIAGAIAHEYASLLGELRHAHGVERIVTRLAREVTPRHFGNPRAALDSLRSVDRVRVLSRQVERGDADVQEIRRALAEDGGAGQPVIERARLVGHLLTRGDPADRALLEGEPTLDHLWRDLVSATASTLLQPDTEKRDWYLDLARRHGRLEQLLVELLDGPPSLRESYALPVAQGEVLGLVLREARRRGGVAGWNQLAGRLARSPHFTFELLTREVEAGGGNLPALLDWLQSAGPVAGPGPGLMGAALGRTPWPDGLDAELAGAAPRHVSAAFEVARQRGRAEEALLSVWPWLVGAVDGFEQELKRRWLVALEQAAATGPARPAAWARHDLLALIAGDAWRVPMVDRLGGDAAAYLAGFREVYRSLPRESFRRLAADRLLSLLDQQRWTTPVTVASGVLGILDVVLEDVRYDDGLQTTAIQVVGRGAATGADFTGLPRYQERWARLVETDPHVAAAMAVGRLHRALTERAGAEHLAGMAAVVVSRAGAEALVEALAASVYGLRGSEVHPFLLALGPALRRQRDTQFMARDVQIAVADAVLTGHLGAHVGQDYRAWLADVVPAEIQLGASLLRAAGVVLDPPRARMLEEAQADLADVAGGPGVFDRLKRHFGPRQQR